MKKTIALIGAFFMGALAFAQVSKNDTINKTASRKVMSNDLKNRPPDADNEVESDAIKRGYNQKTSSQQNGYMKISDQTSQSSKATVIQKGKSSATSMSDETITQKGREGKMTTTEKQHYTIKMSNADKKVVKDSISKPTKSSDTFIKISDVKGE